MGARESGKRRIASAVAFCVMSALVLSFASAVLKPGRSILRGDGGAAWSGYLAQRPGSVDVVFLGNSHVFEGVDPAAMWRHRGITGYVLGGPVQTVQIGEYYLAEALRTQTPRVVAIEMSSARYDRANFVSSFQQINVGYMPAGANKLAAGTLATPAGERLATLCDLMTYHGRWSELTARDLDLAGKVGGDAHMKGFLPKFKPAPVSSVPASAPPDPKLDARIDANLPALRRIARSCGERGIEVVLFVTPTGPPDTYARDLRRVATLTGEFDNVRIVDLGAPGAVPDLDYSSDFINSGHLSYTGAVKASRELAERLAVLCRLPDHRGDPAYAVWDEDARARDRSVAAMLAATR